MTEEEGFSLLCQLTKEAISNSGWWIFNKRNLIIAKTRTLEPYEKSANLPLPPFINIGYCTIDHAGILDDTLTEWSAICVSAIQTETTYDAGREKTHYTQHLYVCLQDGSIMKYLINDYDRFKGLLGHFIELYKLDDSGNKR